MKLLTRGFPRACTPDYSIDHRKGKQLGALGTGRRTRHVELHRAGQASTCGTVGAPRGYVFLVTTTRPVWAPASNGPAAESATHYADIWFRPVSRDAAWTQRWIWLCRRHDHHGTASSDTLECPLSYVL